MPYDLRGYKRITEDPQELFRVSNLGKDILNYFYKPKNELIKTFNSRKAKKEFSLQRTRIPKESLKVHENH